MLAFAIFAFCFLTTLLIAILWLYPSSKKVTTIPGMNPSSKQDGNLSDIGRAGSLHEFLMALHKQYGPIAGFWWGQMYTVSIASPELFKQHSNVFDRPPSLFKMFEPLVGVESIQYANGADGHNRRAHYDRYFAHDKLCTYFEVFQKAADEIAKNWSCKSEEDHIPLTAETFVFSVSCGLEALLGESFQDIKLVQSFRTAYKKAWNEMEHRLIDPILPDKNSPRMKQFEEALNEMHEAIAKVVKQRKENVLQGVLLIDEVIEISPNDDRIKSDTLTYMVAAFHTTGYLLTWCFYFLASREDVQEKVYKEIIDVLGENGLVDESNINELKYLHQVIDETLRCSVLAPYAARYQNFDSMLGGHKIPKDTPVLHALGVVLQDESVWPEPKRFDPDRFSRDNNKNRHPYAFQPFGFAGKRKCPGYKFSYHDSTILLVTLLRRFKVRLHSDQVVMPVHGLVTQPADEIWVQVTKRS